MQWLLRPEVVYKVTACVCVCDLCVTWSRDAAGDPELCFRDAAGDPELARLAVGRPRVRGGVSGSDGHPGGRRAAGRPAHHHQQGTHTHTDTVTQTYRETGDAVLQAALLTTTSKVLTHTDTVTQIYRETGDAVLQAALLTTTSKVLTQIQSHRHTERRGTPCCRPPCSPPPARYSHRYSHTDIQRDGGRRAAGSPAHHHQQGTHTHRYSHIQRDIQIQRDRYTYIDIKT